MELDNKRFWFEDGDIVLGIEDKHLKLHRDKLMDSLVFSTMLELPQPDMTESFDGCSLVTLHHDTLHDWVPTLNWMYNRSLFELESSTLSIVGRALRISTKYEIVELREWCKNRLLRRWPLTVVDMTTTAMSDAAEAICLARECDLPEILPAAFYALAVQRWSNGSDGGRTHLALPPDDLRRLIVGRELLQERLTALLVNWDPHVHAKFFNLCRGCQSDFMFWLTTKLTPSSHSSFTNWLLRDLDPLSKGEFRGVYLCHRCASMASSVVEHFLAQLQDAIPGYFML